MKHLKTVVIVLLNILFCAVTLWFFVRNSFLRPFSGSFLKETISGIVLLGSLYVNYFLLYPKVYQNHLKTYWLTLVLIAMLTGIIDLAIAYHGIMSCNAQIVEYVGSFNFFSKILLITVWRNLALIVFPFLIRERQRFQQAWENEVKVVVQDIRMLDVTDKKSNIHLVNIDDIFYCHQQRNFTDIFMVQNKNYTRLGSMKHLEQLFGDDFVRITPTELVPFRYIKTCKDNTVIMKKMPWEEEQTTFKLEPKNQEEVAERVVEGLLRYRAKASGKNIPVRPARPKIKRKPVTPPDEKLKAVLSYIENHSNCNTRKIVDETKIPLSTVERCIAVLKKQGLIKFTGSRKNGGYHLVNIPQEGNATEPVQKEGDVIGEKTTEEKSNKKKIAEEKPAEPSSKE
jgi:predicted transcriptional regulator